MPGILPMKVIKVGTSTQTRIAQACDRCRSKKIRCDGVRPCCSQCANVGFECKTSDKLSRRAFPRGYTESLEERVRVLEAETRELKDLLDEKDEKIDMLSRIHSQSSQPIQTPSARRPSSVSVESQAGKAEFLQKDHVFKVQQSPYLLYEDGSDSYFAGTSSGRNFIEAFKHCVQERGRSTADIDSGSLLASSVRQASEAGTSTSELTLGNNAPPRLLSDQLINVFFQEWAPLFPVLHRPTFLTLYERYTLEPESVADKAEIAQLNLVFGIAALSEGTRSSADLESFETQWKAAIDSIITDNSMPTLQALVLAQLFCIQQGDFTRLQTYKGLSTSVSARLGLHQSQKRFALGTLTCETRKKVFWTLYTVDCFTAVLLGLPKHIKDDDVQCEYPVDADDEYVTDSGFQPLLPGEFTKLSSALAFFRASRILSKVLEEVFPARASYDLSLKRLGELSDELDNWSKSLPHHLRLQFAQDKPSTGTITSRSPLLSLTYHYTRALLQRPVICASLGSVSKSSMIAMAGSSKHIIQLIQLLDERGLSFSFCLNRDEVLVLAGFGLLFQVLDLDADSKILKDNSRMIAIVVEMLKKTGSPCAADFDRVASSYTTESVVPPTVPKARIPPLSRHNSDGGQWTQSTSLQSSTRKQLKTIASRFTTNTKTPTLGISDHHRRATAPAISLQPRGSEDDGQASLSLENINDASICSHSKPTRSPLSMSTRPTSITISRPPAPSLHQTHKGRLGPQKLPNLDYLSFGNDITARSTPSAQPAPMIKTELQSTDWEKLLGSLDNGDTNIYDACYGGQPVAALLDAPSLDSIIAPSTAAGTDSADSIAWNAELWALCQSETNASSASGLTPSAGHADSILSFSTDEGLSGSEDFVTDWTSASSTQSHAEYAGVVLSQDDDLSHGHWDSGLSI